MLNISNKFRGILSIGPEWHTRIDYRLKNGETGTLTDMDLMASTLQFIDSTSPSGSFEVGQAASQGLKLTLNNYQGKFTEAELEGAVLIPYIGLVTRMDWRGYQMEWCKRGIFTVDDPKSAGQTINFLAVDNMARFDRVYSESTLAYPATLGQIIADACLVCGVTLATAAFANSDYSVTKRPSDTSTTFRDIVSYVAALSGNFARINADGELELKWYDLSKFDLTDDDSDRPVDFVGITSSDIAKADTTITGVEITGNDENKTVYMSGTDGFTFSIGNPLAQDRLQELADTLGDKLIGFSFRSFKAKASANPAVEAGDVCYIKDTSGNSYRSIITNLTYTLSGSESFSANAESSAENQSKYFSPVQKAQDTAEKAQAGVEEAKTEITQLNGQIVLKADKGELIAEINVSPEQIKIAAEKLELSGLVKITNLENGDTTIDGACIQTGRIESEDGKWWLDLERGKFYLSNGTFAGEAKWKDSDGNIIGSITCGGQAGLMIEGPKVSIESSELTLNSQQRSPVYAKNLEIGNDLRIDDGDIRVNGEKGITTDVPVMHWDGEKTRYLELQDGIIVGVHDD